MFLPENVTTVWLSCAAGLPPPPQSAAGGVGVRRMTVPSLPIEAIMGVIASTISTGGGGDGCGGGGGVVVSRPAPLLTWISLVVLSSSSSSGKSGVVGSSGNR